MKELNEMNLKELFELQKRLGKAVEKRVQVGEEDMKSEEVSLESNESIQDFLDKLTCDTIREFKVLKWTVDPELRIVTDKRSFTMHSNDIGIFIDKISEGEKNEG